MHQTQQARVTNLTNEHNAVIDELKQTHLEQIDAFKRQVDALTNGEADHTTLELQRVTAELEEKKAAHARELEDLHAEHATALAALATTHETDVQNIKNDHSSALENERTNAAVSDLAAM